MAYVILSHDWTLIKTVNEPRSVHRMWTACFCIAIETSATCCISGIHSNGVQCRTHARKDRLASDSMFENHVERNIKMQTNVINLIRGICYIRRIESQPRRKHEYAADAGVDVNRLWRTTTIIYFATMNCYEMRTCVWVREREGNRVGEWTRHSPCDRVFKMNVPMAAAICIDLLQENIWPTNYEQLLS